MCQKKKAKKKRDGFINGFKVWGVIQLSRKVSWHVQAPDNKISGAESVTFINFYVLPTENIGRQQGPPEFYFVFKVLEKSF